MMQECQQLNFGVQLLLNNISVLLKHFQEKNMTNKTNKLTPSWQAVTHLVKKIPAFYGTHGS
jgi:hypothetical protein